MTTDYKARMRHVYRVKRRMDIDFAVLFDRYLQAHAPRSYVRMGLTSLSPRPFDFRKHARSGPR